MKNSSLTLYLEIDNLSFFFLVGESDEYGQFKIAYKLKLPIQGIENNRITDLEEVSDIIKKNIYIIEQELNHTFKEVILILENFDLTFINLSGFKKLNGSQILRENITYILNTLKSCVDKTESKKTVLHIFNSKFYLDNKKVDNLPIGLFGDSYSHELSFTLINSNDHKNFKSIFDKSNLKIKKILIKSFINGVNIINNYKSDTFIHIKIDKNDTKIFYFENNSLKFEENFKFGNDIVIKDISKITLLNIDNLKIVLDKIRSFHDISEDELVEQNFFKDNTYRKKKKKKLIYEIASARIKEISEIILFRNVNFVHFSKISNNIYLELDRKLQSKCLKEIYKTVFSINEKYNTEFINFSSENMLDTAHKLVHFGWKKEAIPISKTKKSFIAALFDRIFG